MLRMERKDNGRRIFSRQSKACLKGLAELREWQLMGLKNVVLPVMPTSCYGDEIKSSKSAK